MNLPALGVVAFGVIHAPPSWSLLRQHRERGTTPIAVAWCGASAVTTASGVAMVAGYDAAIPAALGAGSLCVLAVINGALLHGRVRPVHHVTRVMLAVAVLVAATRAAR